MQVRTWILCFVGVALMAFSCPARAQQETNDSLSFEETLNKQYDLKKQQISRLFQDKVQKISERTSLPEEMRQVLIRQADEVREFDMRILQQKLEMKIKHAKERDVIKERLKNDAMNRVKWIMENERDFQENKKAKEEGKKIPAAPSEAAPSATAEAMKKEEAVAAPAVPSPVASSEAAPSATAEAMKKEEAVAAPAVPSPVAPSEAAPSVAAEAMKKEEAVAVPPALSPVASSEAAPSAATEAMKKEEAAVPPVPVTPPSAISPAPTPAAAKTEVPMPADVDEEIAPLPSPKAHAVSRPSGKEMSSGGLIRETVPAPRVLQ